MTRRVAYQVAYTPSHYKNPNHKPVLSKLSVNAAVALNKLPPRTSYTRANDQYINHEQRKPGWVMVNGKLVPVADLNAKG